MTLLNEILIFIAGFIVGIISSIIFLYFYIKRMMKKLYDPNAIKDLLDKFLPKQ